MAHNHYHNKKHTATDHLASHEANGKSQDKICNHHGCQMTGIYPAPKSKWQPRHYLWFCKEHIIAYNQQWDWYDGMSESEIVKDQLADLTWRRPTYSMQDGLHRPDISVMLDDPLHIFIIDNPAPAPRHKKPTDPNAVFITRKTTLAALKILGLDNPVSLPMVKEAYRQAALKYHPDKQTKGRSKNTTARQTRAFQKINAAYQECKKYFMA
ncbi:MAG: J domain-containing protein [Alphaproteobacteria bacterium]